MWKPLHEHRTKGNVAADAFNVLLRNGKLVVNDNATFVVELNPCSFEVEAFGVWPSANSDKEDISFQLNSHL
jgi:hypothetical protein